MLIELNAGNLIEPFGRRRWSQTEIHRQIAFRVGSFQSLGLAPKDRVFVPFGNRLAFLAELIAVWKLGACEKKPVRDLSFILSRKPGT